MSRAIYKALDGRGRFTLPPECRDKLELESGDLIRIEVDDELPVLRITKLDIVDVNDEDPDKLEALINAAVKTLNSEKKVELATYLLGSRSKNKGGGK